MSISVGVIAEDVRFQRFLEPAILALAQEHGLDVQIASTEKTGGCRPRTLQRMVRSAAECDLLVVGADASGLGHARRTLTFRQKAKQMRPLLEPDHDRCSLAIAAPSVEAWLICDAGSFAGGLERALGTAFAMPERWPIPRTEREAKTMLGSLLKQGTGDTLPLAGFEFAQEIVPQMPLEGSGSPSLSDWARGFVRLMRQVP